eukprot:8029345-Ditylum_brightwellii.AAC.1
MFMKNAASIDFTIGKGMHGHLGLVIMQSRSRDGLPNHQIILVDYSLAIFVDFQPTHISAQFFLTNPLRDRAEHNRLSKEKPLQIT